MKIKTENSKLFSTSHVTCPVLHLETCFINCKNRGLIKEPGFGGFAGWGELNTQMHHEHPIPVSDILSELKKYKLFLLFLKFTEELPHTICFLGTKSNFLPQERASSAGRMSCLKDTQLAVSQVSRIPKGDPGS